MNPKLFRKIDALVTAEAAVIAELSRLYPIGSTLRVILQTNQVTPSRGTVIAYDGGKFGGVRVRLESRKQDVRVIAAENIVCIERNAQRD